MQQEIQIQQDLRINTHMHRSLQMLSLNSLNIYHEVAQFIQENPALLPTDNWDEMLSFAEPYPVSKTGKTDTASVNFLEALPKGRTLQEVLLSQWHLECLNEEELLIGEKIISNLGEQGFHKTPWTELYKPGPCDKKLWRKILRKIQLLDPVGCATEDSFESLLVQMQAQKVDRGLSLDDIKQGLEAWVSNNKHLASKFFHCQSNSELNTFMEMCKTLNPYPGLAHSQSHVSYIYPEFKIFYDKQQLVVRPSVNFTKNLLIDPTFQNIADQKNEAGQQAKEQVQQAQVFLKILHARELTLSRIVHTIAHHQEAFFTRGWTALIPLTQKEVADKLHMHETTVSRAIHNKYLDTPFGIVKIKSLFSSKIGSSGQYASKTSIKEAIRILINDREKKFSDQKICDKLRGLGYKISRRTVTKYRNELEKL